ncbi:MAG: FtsX-like permease family protein [Lachnospiraceae bacterium]
MKNGRFVWLYIKRSFTKNFKKQMFLILGIAVFMTLATERVISSDTNCNDVREDIEDSYWGYSRKFFALSAEARKFLTEHPGVTESYVVKYLEVTEGITNGSFLVSADFPESFLTKYVYGTEPGQGEVALPESARIAGKRPELGQEVVFEVQIGEERRNICAKVSGVFEEHSTYNKAYVVMCASDFETLLHGVPEEDYFGDVYYNCVDKTTERTVWAEVLEKYGYGLVCIERMEGDTGPAYLNILLISVNLIVVAILGAVSMIAIIYILLKDEQKTLGIFRALGATKRQLIQMLTARMAVLAVVGAGLGALLGEGVIWLKRLLMYQKESYNPGFFSVIMIPLAAVVFFLLFQVPGILYLLRKSEIELMNGTEARGEHLVSYQNKRLHRLKCPLWWYSGLEPKRRKLNTTVLCLVTMSSLVFAVSSLLQADSILNYDTLEAVETDYSVSRKEGTFSKQELETILSLPGIIASSYGVQVFEEDLVTWNEKKLCAKLQIIEETTFREFKVAQRTSLRLERFKGTLAEALAGERILVEPTYTFLSMEEMLPGDTLYLRNSQGEELPFEIATVGAKKADGTCDCYVYVSLTTYEKLFGMPELTRFHVALDGISVKEAREAIEGLSKLYTLTENDVLVGYTEGQLEWDGVINLAEEMLISLLISFSFLICYYSFYFLSKKDEYWMLYAQGASKKMLRKIILFQALRLAFLAAVVTAGAATLLAYFSYRKAAAMLEGLATTAFFWWMIPITMLFIILVSVSATWLASGAMLKKLELESN